MSDDLIDKLYGWLEDSGRALELRAARSLAGTPGSRLVLPAYPYEDGVTKKQREGDVMALFGGPNLSRTLSTSFRLAVECKSGSDKPWIAFYDQRRHTHPDRLKDWWLPCGTDWTEDLRVKVVGAFEWENGLLADRLATHAVSALGKESVNSAQDAVMQAMSFARAIAEKGTLSMAGDNTGAVLGGVMPVVVTQAPLFECELGQDGEPILTPVERFDVSVQFAKSPRRRVYVVSEEGLAKLAGSLGRALERITG
ncbi:hypothetical protein [Nocardioides gilvus]|uniref:hypothetical protein n=1 Tax=Nocardioides gilvus TaxID=1735589 RepID=UPI000D743AE2|nr:hypothetical protein [Nocardioides gilvus]